MCISSQPCCGTASTGSPACHSESWKRTPRPVRHADRGQREARLQNPDEGALHRVVAARARRWRSGWSRAAAERSPAIAARSALPCRPVRLPPRGGNPRAGRGSRRRCRRAPRFTRNFLPCIEPERSSTRYSAGAQPLEVRRHFAIDRGADGAGGRDAHIRRGDPQDRPRELLRRRQVQEAVDVGQMAAVELVELDAIGRIVLRAVPPAPVAAFGDQQFLERQAAAAPPGTPVVAS